MVKKYRVFFGPDDVPGGGVTMNKMEDEIADLLNDAPFVGPTDDPPETVSDDPKVEPTSTDSAEAKVEPKVDDLTTTPTDPVVSVKPTESTTPVVDPTVAALQAQIDALNARNEKLSQALEKLSGSSETSKDSEPAKTEVKADVSNLAQAFPDFDLETVLESKENFLNFLGTLLTGVLNANNEQLMLKVPNVVGSYVTRTNSLRDLATEFFTTYPELKRHKKYVGLMANEVHAEFPEYTAAQVLTEAAKRTKEALDLVATAEGVTKKGAAEPVTKAPVLPGASTTRTPAAKPSVLQAEIDDLISD